MKSTKEKIIMGFLIFDFVLVAFWISDVSYTSAFFGQLMFQFFILSLIVVYLITLITIRWFKRKWVNLSSKILATLLILICSPVFLFIYAMSVFDLIATYQKGYDPSFEPIHEIRLEHTELVTYLTNCGATCDFGIVVQQEKKIFPGIKLVKQIAHYYHAQDLEYEYIGDNKVKIINVNMSDYQNLDPTPTIGDTFKTKPWLFF